MNERRDFVAGLRRERERRGIALDDVAEQTKINIALLSGLERGDLARWPTGIFRRAFVRSYATCIGLDADAVVSLFVRCFPEPGDDRVVTVPAFESPAHPDRLRLTLASHPRPSIRVIGLRALGAVVDATVILGCSGLAYVAGAASPNAVALWVALAYFTAGTLLLEASPGWWCARRWVRVRPASAGLEIELDPATDGLPAESEQRRQVADAPVRPGRRDRRGARPDRQRATTRPARRLS